MEEKNTHAEINTIEEALADILRSAKRGYCIVGSDVAGFSGGTIPPRLYIRWAQLGLFSAHARCHGESSREPWRYGPRAEEIFRTHAKLREQLMPYLVAQARESCRTGVPRVSAAKTERLPVLCHS